MLVCLAAGWAQPPAAEPRPSLKIDFPPDSPVSLVSADLGDSVTTTRGSAMVIDLRTSLSLRNSASARICGITLLVAAHEVTAGGKASVAVPSLGVAPGETFPVRIDLRLMRPLFPTGPLVEVRLDGVLFEDLSFYGPNRLNSRRSLTVWELEARRDRRHFKSVLAARGEQGLREELLQSLARQASLPRVAVRMERGGRATNQLPSRRLEFAFLRLPGAPLEPLAGEARVTAEQAFGPVIEVRNRSDRSVRYFEIGWLVRDAGGREFLAGSVPAADPGRVVPPGARAKAAQEVALRFSAAPGRLLPIESMAGFVSQVEFADGSLWIPAREALAGSRLAGVVAPSAEEQRLADLYRRKGLAAVVAELNRF